MRQRSKRLAEHGELEKLIQTVKHEFAEKKKRRRGRIHGEARWPDLGLLIYADLAT